jgi:GNAT superfamily N-acetyltransferase
VTIRFATPADAAAIAEIHVQTWRAAYAGIVPAAVLASLSETDRARQWKQGIESDPRRVLVAEADGRMTGWIAVGPCRDADGQGLGEVYAVYVRPAVWHAGVGRALMAAGEEELRRRGRPETALWVLERNERARDFYVRLGYEPDGATKELALGGAALRELRFRNRGRPTPPPPRA